MPTTPTNIQKKFSTEYPGSRLRIAHHSNAEAATVFKDHTNDQGLAQPSQLTALKQAIRSSTPNISIARIWRNM